MQSNRILGKKHLKSPLKSVNCSKLAPIVDNSWNIPFFAERRLVLTGHQHARDAVGTLGNGDGIGPKQKAMPQARYQA